MPAGQTSHYPTSLPITMKKHSGTKIQPMTLSKLVPRQASVSAAMLLGFQNLTGSRCS